MTVVSRRTMLSGAAATAVTAVGSIDATRPVEAANSMDLFLGLSSALTGIAVDRLNPKRPPSQRASRDVLDVKHAITRGHRDIRNSSSCSGSTTPTAKSPTRTRSPR